MPPTQKAQRRSCTPYDLFDAPELAAMDALDAVLEIAVAAVLAANPELIDGDLFEDEDIHAAQVWIADHIIDEARSLRTSLERYRRAIEAAQRPRASTSLDDDDIPF